MLSPERWEMVERIFHLAEALPPGQYAAFVESQCGGDQEVRTEVLSLLEAGERSDPSVEGLGAQVAADWAGTLERVLVGRLVDGYRVEALLGAGGMGETYLAEDTALKRPVVLKFLPLTVSNDVRRVQRFIAEARTASALNHPGIVTVYGFGIFEGHRYIATEFIDGDTVRKRIQAGSIPLHAALDIAIQTAAALNAAHCAGIIHRDIKPENIMVRRDGLIKLIDFGIALPSGSDDGRKSLTRAGEILGTLDYMAPEQAAGAHVDARADLYGLTVVLHEMLTGQLPREMGGPPKLAGGSQAGIVRLMRRGLATDPANRPRTAAELQRELEDLRGRSRKPYIRSRWIAMAAPAVLACGLIAYRWWPAARTPGITSLIVMPLKSLGSPDQGHLSDGMEEAIITRLNPLPRLRVPPAAAIRSNEDPFDAARRLGVEAVLTGSVQRSGDRLRVSVQLSRAADHSQIWSWQYDEDFNGIFNIQDDIAERVAGSLAQQLSPNDRQNLTRHPNRNSQAYDLYLRGRDQWALRTPASIRTAIQMFEQAIAIEPTFALAQAGLADSYNLSVSEIPPLTRGPLAKAAALRAIALDPQSSEAHTALAFALYKFEWKWGEADREFRHAIELNPHYALAHHWYGEFLKMLQRHDESAAQFRLALEDDPFSIPIRWDFVLSLLDAGRVAEARTIVDQCKAIDPNAVRTLRAEGSVLAAEGHPEEAMEARLRSELVSGEPEQQVNADRAAYRAGGERAVDRLLVTNILASMKPGAGQPRFAASALSECYARLRDPDQTLKWLGRAADLREDAVLLLRTRLYDFLRGDPRFIALERRVGLVR